MLKLPRKGSLSLQILEFIGSKTGVRYGDIQRFICEKQGKDYDLMVPTTIYDYKTRTSKPAMVRRWKGIWGTNLCHGRNALLNKYCVKGMDKRWHLSPETANLIADMYDAEGLGRMVYFTNGLPLRPLREETVEVPAEPVRFEFEKIEQEDGSIVHTWKRPEPKKSAHELIALLQEARAALKQAETNLNDARQNYSRALELESKAADAVREALEL